MDIYVLDKDYLKQTLVEGHESMIWTERLSSFGDFELYIPSTDENRAILKEGLYLSIPQSRRLMKIEVIEDKLDEEERRMLVVKGRSMEIALEDRIARGSNGSLTAAPKWLLNGKPAVLARKIFTDICRTGILSANDILPRTVLVTTVSAELMPEPLDPIKLELEPQTVYAAIKDICDSYDLGFGIFLVDQPFGVANPLSFEIFTGRDRTSTQTTNAPVIFAPDLDNLENTTALISSASAKNVAYVVSPNMMEIVYATGVDPTVKGYSRRVLLVKVDNIEEGLSALEEQAYLVQRGREELAKNRYISAFDGEITQYSQYRYGVDYGLGDLVELRNSDGATNQMLVTEQIFVSDPEGERSYPTLSLYNYIQPGSWLSWDQNKVWGEMTVEEWVDMP